MSKRIRFRGLLGSLAVLALLGAGCGSDDDGSSAQESTEETAEAGSGEQVEVVMTDFAFEGLPASVEPGTEFTLVNEAQHELHEMVAFLLDDDEDRSVEELADLPPEEMAATLGEPTMVLLAEPEGPTIAAVGDGTLTESGRYAIMCFIPTGVDPEEYLAAAEETDGPPEIEGAGPPHFVHGMYGEVTVE